MSPIYAPPIPTTTPVTAEVTREFQALKQSLHAITSWSLSPNERMEIKFTEMGNEEQAKAFLGLHK
jgi:hypothetical protein